MWNRILLLLVGTFVLAGMLGGCASAGGGGSAPYAGLHSHQRDAKQGGAPSAEQPAAAFTRKSLRPAS